MDIVLFILGFSLLLAGFAGSILPILPGPPLGWAGLLVISFSETVDFSNTFLIWMAIIAGVITALDYYIPVWGTKKFGGTKAGIRGSTVGLILGLFFAPIGIIIGPAIGAFVGEMIHERNSDRAMKSAVGSFIGFLAGTGLKIIYGAYALYKAIVVFF
ncbi:DUF456 domain-containing protein [Phaeocystidibacter luteus]|uniref:DUF456 domain-containing protein n=1 Tax=Phaeocystidibacter luteus TaxID=911197 RepID=A0A6N6RLK8_9FLAO|nr:DUF456 domain-containing protein [Phaeocystidibacter luteus]KAB2814450.1 DUF456 domain-containing protein [Phaeocystidibacter luteus]